MMLIRSERNPTISLSLLLMLGLSVFAWLYPSNAQAVGNQQKIEGLLLDFSVSPQAILAGIGNQPNPQFGLSTGRCVLRGIELTGFDIEAINYQTGTLGCWFFHQVDTSIPAPGWCSQWVIPVPNGQNHCLPAPSSANFAVVWGGFSCHTCDCTSYDVYHHAPNATSYTMQQSITPFGPWINNGTTAYTSSTPHIAAGGRWMRVKASNSTGSAYSSAHWAAGVCDFCDGDGAEP